MSQTCKILFNYTSLLLFAGNTGNAGTSVGKCSHTAAGRVNPWWRVDLGQSYKIATVSLTKRAGCCTEQLSNFEIRIGDTQDDKNGGVANQPISGSLFEVSRGVCFENHLNQERSPTTS